MNSRLLLGICTLFLVGLVPNLAYASPCGTFPTGVIGCIPFNAVNTQGSTTATGMTLELNNLPINAFPSCTRFR